MPRSESSWDSPAAFDRRSYHPITDTLDASAEGASDIASDNVSNSDSDEVLTQDWYHRKAAGRRAHVLHDLHPDAQHVQPSQSRRMQVRQALRGCRLRAPAPMPSGLVEGAAVNAATTMLSWEARNAAAADQSMTLAVDCSHAEARQVVASKCRRTTAAMVEVLARIDGRRIAPTTPREGYARSLWHMDVEQSSATLMDRLPALTLAYALPQIVRTRRCGLELFDVDASPADPVGNLARFADVAEKFAQLLRTSNGCESALVAQLVRGIETGQWHGEDGLKGVAAILFCAAYHLRDVDGKSGPDNAKFCTACIERALRDLPARQARVL